MAVRPLEEPPELHVVSPPEGLEEPEDVDVDEEPGVGTWIDNADRPRRVAELALERLRGEVLIDARDAESAPRGYSGAYQDLNDDQAADALADRYRFAIRAHRQVNALGFADTREYLSGAPPGAEARDRIDQNGDASHARAVRGGGLNPMSWADLMATPATPPPVLRPGVPKVGLTVLAGAPKVGKTLRLSQIALESGVPAVLVIEEGSLAGVSYRLRRQAAALELTDPPLVVLHRQRIRLDDRASVARLRALFESIDPRPELVGFDPLNKLHAQDENKPAAMTPVLEAMAAIAYELECAVIATHHLAKPSSERGHDIMDRFRGATSIRSGTDANLVMDGQGDVVKLVGEFRDAEPLVEYLELDSATLLFSAGEEPETPSRPSKVDPVALRALVEERGQVVVAQVVERFGVSKPTATAALRALGCDEFEGARGALTFTLRTGK